MSNKSRLIVLMLFVVASLLLTGCVGAFGASSVETVQGSEVTTSLQFLDRSAKGPVYNISVQLPNDWVGKVVMQNLGNVVNFRSAETNGLLFSIEALSERQYWKASGSYPASQVNIINRGDTYFVYHLPVDAHYSGLAPDVFAAYAAAVPDVIASFKAEVAR